MKLEVCVDDVAGLAAAVAGGADRIELCAALSEGGLTPSVGFMDLAAGCGVPVRAMIRPRGGDFNFSERELNVMCTDIAAVRAAGLEGVVLGVSDADGRLALDPLRRLVAAANGMRLTMHRVIDGVPDQIEAVIQARDLGFDCVLSSGGAASAEDGCAMLAMMCAVQGITVMPGAGISAANAARIATETGAAWMHGSFKDGVAAVRAALL